LSTLKNIFYVILKKEIKRPFFQAPEKGDKKALKKVLFIWYIFELIRKKGQNISFFWQYF